MATYSSGDRFDSGIRYDQAPAATIKRVMSKPKLELKQKTDAELLGFARAHHTAMNGNANFPAPLPAAAAFLVIVDDFDAAVTEADTKDKAAQAAFSAKDAQRELLEVALTQRANSVEITSSGDETKILSAGFSTRSQPAPIGAMTQPQNLRATMGTMTGVINVQWNSVKGAKSYILDCRTHGATPGPWSQAKILTTTKFALTGLTPGQEYSFRVRAVGSAGEGPWSDEAVKMAPA